MRGVTVIVPPSLWILAYGSCDENSTLSPLTLALMELRSAPDSLSPCGAFGFQGLLKNASRWKLRSNSSASSTRMSLRMFSTNLCTSTFFRFFVELLKSFVSLQCGLSTESGPRSHVSLVLDFSKTIVFIEYAIYNPMYFFFCVISIVEYSFR